MDIRQKFGIKIKQLRTEKGLSQEKLALNAGLDRTYLPSIEKGERNVSLEVIKKLALALNVKPSELID
ncbi:helix-turn-helix transcriptional regulator [Flavobacteriaceae bacterium]|nr:helix-turn-helix transcriptional regulator [Flavobacteriaceae bacterium]